MATSATSPTQTTLLTRRQAAALLGCSEKSIRNYIASGNLPAYRVRGSRLLRIRRADLESLLVRIPTTGNGGE